MSLNGEFPNLRAADQVERRRRVFAPVCHDHLNAFQNISYTLPPTLPSSLQQDARSGSATPKICPSELIRGQIACLGGETRRSRPREKIA